MSTGKLEPYFGIRIKSKNQWFLINGCYSLELQIVDVL